MTPTAEFWVRGRVLEPRYRLMKYLIFKVEQPPLKNSSSENLKKEQLVEWHKDISLENKVNKLFTYLFGTHFWKL